MDTSTILGGRDRGTPSMARAARVVAAGMVLFALLLTTGCGHAKAPSTAGSTVAATPAAAPGTTDQLRLNVQRAPSRSVGYYTVDSHDGSAPKRTTFTTTTKGKWSTAISVPHGAQVKIVVLRLPGGTCTITQVRFAPDHNVTLDTGPGLCTATAP